MCLGGVRSRPGLSDCVVDVFHVCGRERVCVFYGLPKLTRLRLWFYVCVFVFWCGWLLVGWVMVVRVV